MAETVYLLCAATSLACAVLLLRGYWRDRMPLILWTCLCFLGLAANNVILFVDVAVVSELDLRMWRNLTAVLGAATLLFGMIHREET